MYMPWVYMYQARVGCYYICTALGGGKFPSWEIYIDLAVSKFAFTNGRPAGAAGKNVIWFRGPTQTCPTCIYRANELEHY